MFVQTLLEGGAREASCYGITGQTPEAASHIDREEKIRQIIEDTGVGVVDIDQLRMETLVYEDFDSIGSRSETSPSPARRRARRVCRGRIMTASISRCHRS